MSCLWVPIRSTHERKGTRLSLANAAARGGVATVTGQLFRFLINMAAVAILARLITPADYGLYTMVFAILGVATVLGDFGLSMAAIQSQTITQSQRTNLFWTNASLGVILSIAVFFSAPLIASFYSVPELTGIAQALAVTFLFNALSAQFKAEVSVKLRFVHLALTDVFAAAAALVAAIAMAMLGYGYWALVGQQLALTTVTLLGLVVSARWWPGLPKREANMRALYTYGANTLGVQLFVYATSSVDSILIGRVWGATALGLYDRAFRIFRLPLQQIAAPMTKVGVPILSKLQSDDRYEGYVQRAQLVLGYAFGGMFFLLAAASDPVIDLLLGPGWEPAKAIFAVLAIGGVFQGMGFVYAWVFLSRALTGMQLRWTMIGRSCMVAAMCVGVLWGPLGVAFGATIGQAINWTLLTLYPMGKTGVRRAPLIRVALRPILLYTPMTTIALILSYGVMDGWDPWLQAGVLAAFMGIYLSAAALIPQVRLDYVEFFDLAKRLRR